MIHTCGNSVIYWVSAVSAIANCEVSCGIGRRSQADIVISSRIPWIADSTGVGVHPAVCAHRVKAIIVQAGSAIKVCLPQAVAHLVYVRLTGYIDKIKVKPHH